MNFWLYIGCDYYSVYVVLCKQNNVIATHAVNKADSNKELIIAIDSLLKENSATLADISHIGVNLGPAPYTSLRITLATVNSIAYATHIPLIGIDGLKALIEEYQSEGITIALLNAFNNELFYGIDNGILLNCGYNTIDHILEIIKQSKTTPLTFVGNGTTMGLDAIKKTFRNAHIPDQIPDYASLEALIKQGWQRWQKQEFHATELFPLYLKDVSYKNSINVL